MGKRKATRMAMLRAGDTTGLKRKIEELSTISENLQVLLRRETEKTTTLQSQVDTLTADLTKALENNASLEAQLTAVTAKKAEVKTTAPKVAKTTTKATTKAAAKPTKKTTTKARAAGA